MRTVIRGAAFLVVSAAAGTASAQTVLNLKGSDTLELVTKDVIAGCTGAVGNINYIGGGSGTGQSAMAAGSQHVAPMSRQLNNAQCTGTARQLLIGLDGIVVVAKNPTHTDPGGGTCTDDVGGTASTGGPLVLNGVPQKFVLCTSDAQCVTAGGTTCNLAGQYCNIGGSILGCDSTQGCSPAGTYTFDNGNGAGGDDWKDVLAQIYGGQNHVTASNPQTIDTGPATIACASDADCSAFGRTCNLGTGQCNPHPLCTNADGTNICAKSDGTARAALRNPTRIDCANPVRGVLLASYGSVVRSPVCSSNPAQNTCTVNADCPFNQTCTAGLCTCAANNQCALGQTCNTGTGVCSSNQCAKVKHAFRRDDLSGTTDAFQALVGLIAIAGQTTLRSSAGGSFAPEITDLAAVASPFCNAGNLPMNKGFTDGLDLDPYRRSCDAGPAPDRFGLENVCQPWAQPTNADTGCYVAGGTPAVLSPVNYPQRERSSPQGRGMLNGGSVDTLAALQNDYLTVNATKPRCLGVVLPISIPTDVAPATAWAGHRYPPASAGTCTAGARGFVNPWAGHAMLCPDGLQKAAGGTCKLAINTATNAFDCTIDSPLPGGAVSDARVFNLMPVNALGHMGDAADLLQDAYANPNFPTATQLRRFARRYYGLHMVRVSNLQSQATTTAPCLLTDDTSQIGCLVKASPCSIGFAGREASDVAAPFGNVALRMVGVQPTQTTIENLATGGTPVYGIARKLWFNSFEDPIIGFTQPNLTAAESALAVCMGLPPLCAADTDCNAGTGGSPPCNLSTGRCTAGVVGAVDNAIFAHNFVKVPPTVPRFVLSGTNGCPLP